MFEACWLFISLSRTIDCSVETIRGKKMARWTFRREKTDDGRGFALCSTFIFEQNLWQIIAFFLVFYLLFADRWGVIHQYRTRRSQLPHTNETDQHSLSSLSLMINQSRATVFVFVFVRSDSMWIIWKIDGKANRFVVSRRAIRFDCTWFRCSFNLLNKAKSFRRNEWPVINSSHPFDRRRREKNGRYPIIVDKYHHLSNSNESRKEIYRRNRSAGINSSSSGYFR